MNYLILVHRIIKLGNYQKTFKVLISILYIMNINTISLEMTIEELELQKKQKKHEYNDFIRKHCRTKKFSWFRF